MSTRWIIVDDVDPRIQYNGPWFSDQGSQDSRGDFGTPFRSTLHGTQADASLSFTFHGTQVEVIGTLDIRNNSGVLDPTWQCFIDNIRINVDATFTDITFNNPQNQQVFCSNLSLSDGPHIITVNATVQNQTFWFDNIQYAPSASVPLDQEIILVEYRDPQLQYGPGWSYLLTPEPEDAIGHGQSESVGGLATLNFSFIGVSLSWYGFLLIGNYIHPVATYSIDGQTPINFEVQYGEITKARFQQKFFEIAQLPAGPHTLNVLDYGGNNTTPLSIHYLIIQNGTLPSTTILPSTTASASPYVTPSATGSSVSGTSTQRKSSTPVGAIIGGVVGGLALTVFIIFGFLLLRRRQKRAKAIVINSMPQPFNHTPPLHPSSTMLNTPSGGISHSQAPQITKGHRYGPIPSLNASPDAIANTTNLRHVPPLHRPPLVTINPLLPTLPPVVSRPSPLTLPSETNRQVEGLAVLGPQLRGDGPPDMVSMQNNGTRSPTNPRLHEDSGIRMPPSTPTTDILMDLPPLYTAD
ncbi:hypothetical protein BYT27DRAFT_7341793 [Phlegmacium glaucopus]|nr:hypothetical protein BYT27DRAFT_7341793 [Phlegmacium glaucopus]